MLLNNHMIACLHKDKDETSEMLCLLKLKRESACRARHLSVACARDQTKRNGQLPIPTGLASCLTASYSHQHLSCAAIRSFHVKQSHHDSLQPDCRRTQYLDKAAMQDAAGRSSDPEPLTVEDKPIAISIMPIASRTFPVRVMGMRRSASTMHPRSIFFWPFSTPHAHHMPSEECM
jgi:hypothetical protein